MSHYNTLGVAKDATADEIKQGYRRESSRAHPDREGGSHAAQQCVNRAYEVLSDPERRARYDATGSDEKGPPIETMAREYLLNEFKKALDLGADMLASVRGELHTNITRAATNRVAAGQRKRSLEKTRKRVIAKKGSNLVHGLIDQELQAIDEGLKALDIAEQVTNAALALLNDYESLPDETMAGTAWTGIDRARDSGDAFAYFNFGFGAR